MNGEYIGLAARIQQMLIDLNRVVERAASMLTKAQNSGDNGYYDAIALNLRGFYSGVKQIFENDVRTLFQYSSTCWGQLQHLQGNSLSVISLNKSF